jgi:hypothetical protein
MPPYGLKTIMHWVRTVLAGETDPMLWTSLDDRLRLTLAQGWILETLGVPDDDLAEDLADEDTDNPCLPTLLAHLSDRWRSVYADLEGDFGILDRAFVVGVDMELIILTGPEYVGESRAGTPILAHCFIIKFENDEWKIAALARRIPVPGWPPTAQIIPNLEFEGDRVSDG